MYPWGWSKCSLLSFLIRPNYSLMACPQQQSIWIHFFLLKKDFSQSVREYGEIGPFSKPSSAGVQLKEIPTHTTFHSQSNWSNYLVVTTVLSGAPARTRNNPGMTGVSMHRLQGCMCSTGLSWWRESRARRQDCQFISEISTIRPWGLEDIRKKKFIDTKRQNEFPAHGLRVSPPGKRWNT